MNRFFKHIALAIVMATAVTAMAEDAIVYHARHDTLYIYSSWESVMAMSPDMGLTNPMYEVFTPWDLDITSPDRRFDKYLEEAVAVSFGDSLWYISPLWLQKNFKGDSKRIDFWTPFYFTSKTAFIQHPDYVLMDPDDNAREYVIEFGGDLYSPNEIPAQYYLLDFSDHKVKKVNNKVMSQLLEDAGYRDLLMLYEGMKNYKKTKIINDYFLRYLMRAVDDPMVPPIPQK